MPESNLQELLKNYHQGNITPDEQARLFEELNKKSNLSQLTESMSEILEKTPSTSPLGFDKDEIFSNISSAINQNKEKQAKKISFVKITSLVAASIALVLLSIFGYQELKTQNSATMDSVAELRTFETTKGQFRTVSLPDGTVVKLNTSSSLRVSPTYSSNPERIVYLEGEAFFDVHRDVNKPFKVKTNEVEVTVLGTSFNVNSKFKGQAIKVAVASGKVKVENNNRDNQVFLEKNQMVTIADNQFLKLTGFDQLKEYGWADQKLVFVHAGFAEVITQIENWYGVEISVKGEANNQSVWDYTATFDSQKLENVLLSLSFVKDFEYEIDGKKVQLKF